MTAHFVVHRQTLPDDFGIRYSCAWADVDGDRIYFIGEDHGGVGQAPPMFASTGKYANFEFQIPTLDLVARVFDPNQNLESIAFDYGVSWEPASH